MPPPNAGGVARSRSTLSFALAFVRIPVIAPTRSDASRPPVPTDRDQCVLSKVCLWAFPRQPRIPR